MVAIHHELNRLAGPSPSNWISQVRRRSSLLSEYFRNAVFAYEVTLQGVELVLVQGPRGPDQYDHDIIDCKVHVFFLLGF